MKKALLSLLLLLPLTMGAQNVRYHTQNRHRVLENQEKAVFYVDEDTTHVDRFPVYMAGMDALYGLLYKYINYPEEAYRKNIGSKVEARFVIDTKGKARLLDIGEGPSEMFRKRVEMAIRNMGGWTPGVVEGHTKEMTARITVMFTIEEEESESTTSFFSLTMDNLDAVNHQLRETGQGNLYPMVRVYLPFSYRPYWSDGDAALQEVVNADLGYPEKALKKGESGLLDVTFQVDTKGEVSDVEVRAQGNAPTLEKEVKSFIKKHHGWHPGCEYGISGDMQARLQFTFDADNRQVSVRVF